LQRPIVLLTDFGHRDPFVGIMKCVIANIAPQAPVIDLVHDLPPQDIRAGAMALEAAVPYLPKRAVVLAVVDPGVGTDRRMIAGAVDDFRFVGPDNGLLARALAHAQTIVEITEAKYFLPQVSSTFHGRDVFAPVAAHLSKGLALEKLGPPAQSLRGITFREPSRIRGVVTGEVLLIDRYGNALTNIPSTWTTRGQKLFVAGQQVEVCRTYGEVPTGVPVAVPGSTGTLEIAVRDGDAAKKLGIQRGDPVEVRA
jgi:S-adenosyl-L-methionine hydrolase (adenosine-forming)